MTCQQLVKHRTESIDIGRTGELRVISNGLFWRHVTGCAQHFQRARDRALGFDQAC